jgi:hypothetical protein
MHRIPFTVNGGHPTVLIELPTLEGYGGKKISNYVRTGSTHEPIKIHRKVPVCKGE